MNNEMAISGLVPGKPKVSSRLSLQVEADLIWYFGVGQSVFQRSTFGTMLERQKLFAFGTKPCPRCRPARASKETQGTGFEENGDQCRQCLGMGFVSNERRHRKKRRLKRRANRQQSSDSVADAATQDTERKHTGLTAIPKPTPRQESGYLPDDEALNRYAQVSRQLDAIAEVDPISFTVLELYYGDQGARWGRTDRGRIFALYAMTPAGQRLAQHSRKTADNPIEQSDSEELGLQETLQRTRPTKQRRELFDQADQVARRLHHWAAIRWNVLEQSNEGAQ